MAQTSQIQADSARDQAENKNVDWEQWPNDAGFNSWFEVKTPVELMVTGIIPPYVAGTLYRTGPSAYKVARNKGEEFQTSHWFDGWSKVHRFQITAAGTSSKVLYNSRSNVDKLINSIRETGSMQGFSFAQKRDPCQSFFKKVMSTFIAARAPGENIGVTLSVNMPGLTTAANDVATERHASAIQSLVSKTDNSKFKQLDPETLEPIGIASQAGLHPDLTGQMSAAHAKSDPETGDIYNFNLDIKGPKSTYRVFHTSASTGETDILVTFMAAPVYMHSLFLTSDHVIICLWGSRFMKGGLSILYNKNILDSLAFSDSQPATWYVVDRRHGKGMLASYQSPNFFCFHTVNAWTETSGINTDVICELNAYSNMDVLTKFYYENLLSSAKGNKAYKGAKGDSSRGSLRRYRLPSVPSYPTAKPGTAILESTAPAASSPELPTLNPRYVAKPHRYTYGIADRGLSSFADSLVKWDSETKTAVHWEAFANTPGEPICVPDPNGADEDDAVLLSVVLDGIKGRSFLLCLDAKTMGEIGRADVNGVVGFGFHGIHVKAGANRTVNF